MRAASGRFVGYRAAIQVGNARIGTDKSACVHESVCSNRYDWAAGASALLSLARLDGVLFGAAGVDFFGGCGGGALGVDVRSGRWEGVGREEQDASFFRRRKPTLSNVVPGEPARYKINRISTPPA